ncbi:hypothetical protein [Pedobacter nutrimenti]|nr:hypothetical protein [Pedobacter nutrimenti]
MILFLYSSTDKQQCLTRIDIDKEMDFHFVVSEKKKKDKQLMEQQNEITGMKEDLGEIKAGMGKTNKLKDN